MGSVIEFVMSYMSLVMASLSILMGVWATILGMLNINRAKRSKRWPNTEGEIMRSEVKIKIDEDNEQHHPDIQYQYSVSGVMYKASRISFGKLDHRNLKRDTAAETVKEYSVGQRILVWYDPLDPNQATLVVGADVRGSYTQLILGLIFIGVGAAKIVWHF
jgi:Protein of unknown function (DUF3592)